MRRRDLYLWLCYLKKISRFRVRLLETLSFIVGIWKSEHKHPLFQPYPSSVQLSLSLFPFKKDTHIHTSCCLNIGYTKALPYFFFLSDKREGLLSMQTLRWGNLASIWYNSQSNSRCSCVNQLLSSWWFLLRNRLSDQEWRCLRIERVESLK